MTRKMTDRLISAGCLDIWPDSATICDFGIDSSNHLGAIQWAVRHNTITPEELDNALGNGPELTRLIRTKENPYGLIEFKTAWDDLLEEEEI